MVYLGFLWEFFWGAAKIFGKFAQSDEYCGRNGFWKREVPQKIILYFPIVFPLLKDAMCRNRAGTISNVLPTFSQKYSIHRTEPMTSSFVLCRDGNPRKKR